MRKELLRNGTDSLRLDITQNGRAVVPATCSVRVMVDGAVAQSGTASGGVFTPSGSVVNQARQNVVVEWTYTLADGLTHKRVELVDVVLFKLEPVVGEDDLIAEAPSLVSSERVYYGACSESSVTAGKVSVTDSNLVGTHEGWAGGILHVLTGAQAGKQFVLTDADPLTGVVAYADTVALAVGDTFYMRRSFQAELDAAWEDLYDKLIAQCANAPGGLGSQQSRPYLIMTPDRLRRPHSYLALEKIFRGIATDPQSADWQRADYYAKKFEETWNNLSFVYAEEGDTVLPEPVAERSSQWGFER